MTWVRGPELVEGGCPLLFNSGFPVSVGRSSLLSGVNSSGTDRRCWASWTACWSTRCRIYRTPSERETAWNKLCTGHSPRPAALCLWNNSLCPVHTCFVFSKIFCVSGGRVNTTRLFAPYMKKWKTKWERRGRSACVCLRYVLVLRSPAFVPLKKNHHPNSF